jgi:hypothetical protein
MSNERALYCASELEGGVFSPSVLQNEQVLRLKSADELRRLVAENELLRKDAGWRPIETAPKECGNLLLGWVRYQKHRVDDDGKAYTEDGGTIDFIEWQDGGEHGDGYFMATAGPWGDGSDWITHWMPLPSPPDAAKESK